MSDARIAPANYFGSYPSLESERIPELIKKLKPSALKYLSLSLPNAEDTQTNFYDILAEHFNTTNNKKWREQTVAVWGMGFAAIPEEKREETIKALRDLLAERNQPKRKTALKRTARGLSKTARNICITGILFLLLRWILDNVSLEDSLGNTLILLTALAFAVTVVAGMLVTLFSYPYFVAQEKDRLNETRSLAAKSLLRQKAIEALPELMNGAVDKSWVVQCACREALRCFLPQITEANLNLMPANSESLIGQIICTAYDMESGSLIMDYLEKFGQGSSADGVAAHLKEMSRDYGGDTAELEAYRIRVQRLLAILRERQNQDYARQELLRHSSLPTQQADQLLRPAADAQTTPAEQLLRASVSQE